MKKIFVVERDILMYALRYSLGRQTFAPITVIENIKNNIYKLNQNDIKLMIKEIKEQEHYGADVDTKSWMSFLSYLNKKLEEIEE